MPRKGKIPKFLFLIWGLNIIGLLGLGFFLWMTLSATIETHPELATPEELSSAPPTAALSIAPTTYFLPTVTPNPRGTFIAETTPTAFDYVPGTQQSPLPMVIGYSVAGRPLEVFRFGYGASERLIVAGIHGGYEWNTIALADELIAELYAHPELVPPDVTLYILRALNPDGYERGHDRTGRTNENNVDLNHNFPYHWELEWDREGCWNYLPTTGGTHAGSEPETIALMNFINLHNFDALISYHSAALGIFAGGMPPFAPSENLAQKLANTSPYSYPPLDTGCEYSGNLTDWASSVVGIPAVDIELSNHRDTDFGANLRILNVFLNWEE
ncbi:MAG: DUF2817 domain-containing protein [Anaerolineae bacterium]|jgi:hypothetical protein|nr:DUF2817 domain-containing protein [Anaerolineae bacterium]MBT7075074.1 DUF2817 domain-containing protein [Anaerolineae bacterium]MBT7781972.1 DUF2817 domain-containing protein [Anaerolineae bacterium]